MILETTAAFADPAAASRFRRKFLGDALEVADVTEALPGTGIPLVWIDARRRPDVADLVGQHQRTGRDGAVRTAWRFLVPPTLDWGDAVLEVRAKRPIRCVFAIRFDLGRHLGPLAAINAVGKLAVTTVRADLPNRWLGEVHGLMLDCDTDGLGEWLKLVAAAGVARQLGLLPAR